MAVDARHAGRDAAHAGDHSDGFDDPTEDLAEEAGGAVAVAPAGSSDRGEAAPAADPFEPGRVLCGRYELERVVGRGGLSVVLSAFDLRRQAAGDPDARVAVKALRPELRRDEAARHRLISEFRQLQQLSHPNVIRVFDLDRHGDDWFIVMELLEGVSLAGLIRHCGEERLAGHRALGIVRACAEALGWAHGRGVVHGDVKPGNVFATRDHGLRLLDFGTASALAPAAAQPMGGPRACATRAYASPQVLQGQEPTAADDLFSLGCVAFELLSGVHPFDRLDARAAMARGLRPLATPMLEPGMRQALEAALSYGREGRPPTMAAFIAALESTGAATQGQALADVKVAVAGGVQASSRRGWLAGAAVVAGLGAAILLLGGAPAPGPHDAPAPTVPASSAAAAYEDSSVLADPTGDATGDRAGADTGAVSQQREDPAAEALPVRRISQRVGFAIEALLVSRGAPAAAIPVRREGGSNGRAIITWRIDEGSARSGRDFSGPTTGTLVLADGQERGTVFIPLMGGNDVPDDREFAVTIDRISGAAAGGSRARVDVTLRSFVNAGPRALAARD